MYEWKGFWGLYVGGVQEGYKLVGFEQVMGVNSLVGYGLEGLE